MTVPDTAGLSHGLRVALAGPEPAQSVAGLVRGVLTTDPVAWESDEQRLVRVVSERVDTAIGDDARLLALAHNVQALLDRASSSEAVELLLELAAERERVLDIIRKCLAGSISRASYQSFISEQRWPESLRSRLAGLSADELVKVATWLTDSDIGQLEVFLIATPG